MYIQKNDHDQTLNIDSHHFTMSIFVWLSKKIVKVYSINIQTKRMAMNYSHHAIHESSLTGGLYSLPSISHFLHTQPLWLDRLGLSTLVRSGSLCVWLVNIISSSSSVLLKMARFLLCEDEKLCCTHIYQIFLIYPSSSGHADASHVLELVNK